MVITTPRREHSSGQPGADDVLRTVTLTMADELTQPLTVLLATIELSRMRADPPERLHEVLTIVEQAGNDLARRLQRFTTANRYATRTKAGYVVLDLDHAD
jgi:signal transduction histidine kinase